MSQSKGKFVIKNAAGVVTLAGVATHTNSTMSATASDATELTEHKDAQGLPQALTKDFNAYNLDLDLTPGIGGAYGTFAAMAADAVLQLKGAAIITSGFANASLNWPEAYKATIREISVSQTNEGLGTLKVTARRIADTAGSAVDFTGAWQNLS